MRPNVKLCLLSHKFMCDCESNLRLQIPVVTLKSTVVGVNVEFYKNMNVNEVCVSYLSPCVLVGVRLRAEMNQRN